MARMRNVPKSDGTLGRTLRIDPVHPVYPVKTLRSRRNAHGPYGRWQTPARSTRMDRRLTPAPLRQFVGDRLPGVTDAVGDLLNRLAFLGGDLFAEPEEPAAGAGDVLTGFKDRVRVQILGVQNVLE